MGCKENSSIVDISDEEEEFDAYGDDYVNDDEEY